MRYQGIDIHSGSPLELTVEEGLITHLEPIEATTAMPYLSHGFIDIQVNGYLGNDYSSPTLCESDIVKINAALAKRGTTKHAPTIITNSAQRIERNLAVIATAVKKDPVLAQAIVGIHLEGPYISAEEGPRGVHDPQYARDPSIAELDRFITASEGLLKLITLAPERNGAIEFISAATKRGITVSIGHSAATAERLAEAVQAGARLSTHLGNGSHAVLPRLRNYLWEQLADDRLWASIIADSFHLPDSVLKTMRRTKGLERLVLVSDVAYLGGHPSGIYRWGDIAVEVFPDGHLGMPGTTFLAGAGHLLDWDIPHFARSTAVGIADAVRLATVQPARLLALPYSRDAFSVGEPADLVQFIHHPQSGPLEIVAVEQPGRVLP